ncbi:DUF4097 family beta strand repeat-containing protein [Hymenobacter sp. IS2118]|uniref:DUF4097 family beta strand repeat-containing protein n=1 Tax=Hymenobacter sp. IS2118 TaxID=1505605 RepID=UPI00090705DA|nr:hypothetical protein [Hymenobacter sp. IS2118]
MTRLSFRPSLSTLLVLLFSTACGAQTKDFTEKVSKEFTLTDAVGRSTLAVYNVQGSVAVQGYAGATVVVEATRTIRADDAKTLEAGKAEAKPGFLQRNDSVIVYMAGPFDSRPRHNYRGNWNERPIKYRYEVDYVIKVPYAMNLRVSTVNNGTLDVRDVTGLLDVSNVNGSIKLANVQGRTSAHTVNGNVDATYAAPPPGASSYKTINGEITVRYPASLAADLHFKSMHGEFYTDFPNAEILPTQVTKNREGRGGGTVYTLSKATAVRLGKGGPDLRFETLNGNVTVTKQ